MVINTKYCPRQRKTKYPFILYFLFYADLQEVDFCLLWSPPLMHMKESYALSPLFSVSLHNFV